MHKIFINSLILTIIRAYIERHETNYCISKMIFWLSTKSWHLSYGTLPQLYSIEDFAQTHDTVSWVTHYIVFYQSIISNWTLSSFSFTLVLVVSYSYATPVSNPEECREDAKRHVCSVKEHQLAFCKAYVKEHCSQSFHPERYDGFICHSLCD